MYICKEKCCYDSVLIKNLMIWIFLGIKPISNKVPDHNMYACSCREFTCNDDYYISKFKNLIEMNAYSSQSVSNKFQFHFVYMYKRNENIFFTCICSNTYENMLTVLLKFGIMEI